MSAKTARELLHATHAETATDYAEILAAARRLLSENHAADLAQLVDNAAARERMLAVIAGYITQNAWSVRGCDTAAALAERIYDDMAGFGCITRFLQDDTVEEINCNRWDDIEILRSDGWHKAVEHFASPDQCADIAKKMVRLGGVVLDGTKPVAESFISAGTRIAATIPPVAASDAGAVFSIRRQRCENLSREEIIASDTATAEELDFLELCLRCGISVGFAGATSSGKTTDVNYFMRRLCGKLRFFLIEDTRELSDVLTDHSGAVISRIVSTATRYTDEARTEVSRSDLLKLALRYSPDVIVPSEMRGAEAREAIEAARTGHTTLTTLHANSTRDAYLRIHTMCNMAGGGMRDDLQLASIVAAYPIMVFKSRLADGSRRYMEIIEATGYSDGKLSATTLFAFEIEDNVADKDGKTMVKGAHTRCGCISDILAEQMVRAGVSVAEVRRFASPDWRKGGVKK